MTRTIQKLALRRLRGQCIGCGHAPCTCKSRGKLRDRTKGIGRNEAREPSLAQLDSWARAYPGQKGMTMATKLIEQRKPTPEEQRKGAEVVFVREDEQGRKVTICACRCHESWEQWGAHTEALSDNVTTVEAWRRRFSR